MGTRRSVAVAATVVGAFGSLFFVCPVQAADVPAVLSAPVLQRETEHAAAAMRERSAASVTLSGAEKAARVPSGLPQLPVEERSFRIHRIEVRSSENRFHRYGEALSSYEGEAVGAAGIDMLRSYLEARLAADGYVTSRVVVPNQDVAGGVLFFDVVPGYIEDIRLTDGSSSASVASAFGHKRGELLRRQDSEQGIDQIRAVPGQRVKVNLAPGSSDALSVVHVAVERDRDVHGGFFIDDGGYESTGKVQASAHLSLANPAGLNDVLTVSYTRDLEDEDRVYGSSQYALSYRVPAGRMTYGVSAYTYNYRQRIAAVTPFVSEGKTKGLTLSAERVFNRTSRTKTSGVLKILVKERHNYLNGTELGVQAQRTSAVEFGLSHRAYRGATQVDLYGYWRFGVAWFGALKHEWEGSGENPTSSYHMAGLEGELQTTMRIGHKEGRYALRVRSQFSNHRLFGTEQMSIGGRYTVRGFTGEETLRGESRFYIQNEWAIPFERQHIIPYIGLDIGHVWGPSTGMQLGHTLAGAVLGVRGTINEAVSYDLFIGTPLIKPEGFKADDVAWGFRAGYRW